MPPKRSPAKSPRTGIERPSAFGELSPTVEEAEQTEAESGSHHSDEDGEQESLLPSDSETSAAGKLASAAGSADVATVRSEQLKIFSLAWPVGATFILQSSAQQMTIILSASLRTGARCGEHGQHVDWRSTGLNVMITSVPVCPARRAHFAICLQHYRDVHHLRWHVCARHAWLASIWGTQLRACGLLAQRSLSARYFASGLQPVGGSSPVQCWCWSALSRIRWS